jgi:hypothetical protein
MKVNTPPTSMSVALDVQQRAFGLLQVGKCGAIEEFAVVEVHCHVAAGIGRERDPQELDGPKQVERQPGVDVTTQETLFEVVEDPLAEESKVGPSEASARGRADGRNLVDEARLVTIDDDLGSRAALGRLTKSPSARR